MEWTSGYRADIDYTHGYYRELAPGLIDFGLLLAGLAPPTATGDAPTYLELGYGQGVTLNIEAAAAPGTYVGTDFNPVHAANAQSLARVSGAEMRVYDESFAELNARDDLPMFDYIVLHGIWSWVSDENRKVIVDIIRKRLKVGGAVYFSYNTFPGWATAMPLRHLMSLHSETAGTDVQGMVGRIEGSIAFTNKLAEVQARFFQANPLAKTRLDSIAGQNRNYLAHEYFNTYWTPMYFSEVHEWLSEAKLSYAAPAATMEHLDGFQFTAQQREVLNTLPAGVLRETVRDYLQNQQFRRDLYTRGARRLPPLERIEMLNQMRLTLTVPADEIPFEVETGLGKIGLRPEIYRPVIEALAADGASAKTLGDIANMPDVAALPPGALIETIAVLVGSGRAHPAQSEAQVAAARPRCDKLNAYLCERARISSDVSWLASPVIGGGLPVGRFEQMFIAARAKGLKKPADWAKDAWDVLTRQNQSLIKEGQVLKTAEENLTELTTQAQAFADKRLPMLQRLGVMA
jgi:hypothetical protein